MHTDIWFNALALRPGGSGVQTYIRELLRALSQDPGLAMAAAVQCDAVAELPPAVRPDTRPVCSGLRRALQGLRTPQPAAIVHGLDVDLPLRAAHAHTVATVHDCAVVDVPWAFSANRARAERALLARTARTADAIVTPSAFTAQRLKDLYGREATVTPLAASPWAVRPTEKEVARVREAYALPPRFALQVGTIEPRKLTGLLIAAGAEAQLPVVLAGMGSAALTGTGVLGLGHIPTEDLASLYSSATVVCYLSAYEGFGLPPLEAMACGAAVLASAVEPIPEVLGDAAMLVHNRLPDVTSALQRACHDADLVEDLRARGLARAAVFSWSHTASSTRAVYERLLL